MDESVDIVRKQIGEVTLLQFLGLLLIAGGGCIGLIMLAVISGIGLIASSGNTGTIVVATILGVVLSVVLVIALVEAQMGSVISLTDSIFKGKPMKATKAISVGLKNIFKMLGVMVLQGLGLIPVCLIGLLQLFGLGAVIVRNDSWLLSPSSLFRITDHMSRIIFFIIIMLLNIVVFLLVRAIYEAFYITVLPAVIVDGLGPIQAFKQNWQLVKKDFVGVVKKIIVYRMGISGINLCLSMLISAIAIVIMLLVEFVVGEIDYTMLSNMVSVIQWPIQLVYSLIIGTFETVLITIFYHSQKCKVKGTDLQAQLNEVKYYAAKEYKGADGDANSI